MEDYRIDIMIDKGPSARSIQLELSPFTLVGATTRSPEISRIAKKYLHDAKEITIGTKNEGSKNVNHNEFHFYSDFWVCRTLVGKYVSGLIQHFSVFLPKVFQEW